MPDAGAEILEHLVKYLGKRSSGALALRAERFDDVSVGIVVEAEKDDKEAGFVGVAENGVFKLSGLGGVTLSAKGDTERGLVLAAGQEAVDIELSAGLLEMVVVADATDAALAAVALAHGVLDVGLGHGALTLG
jgi:hypothetical protein